MPLLAFVALLAAGIPQDVYDAPPLRADIAAVFEQVTRTPLALGEMPRPDPYHLLAVAYSTGDGAEQDSVTACAYAQLAHASARLYHGQDGKETETAKAFAATLCEPLTYSQPIAAGQTMSCPTAGPRRDTVIELEPGWWVVLNGRQVVIEHPSGTTDALLPTYPCGRFVRIQHDMVVPPSGGPSRHILQTWFWTSAMTDKGVLRQLSWQIIDVQPARLLSLDVRTWWERGPASAVAHIPPALARGARFRFNANGQMMFEMAESGELQQVIAK